MYRIKDTLELIGDMMIFALSAWFLIINAQVLNRGADMPWGEMNHLILGVEVAIASFIFLIGVYNFINDILNRKNFPRSWNFALELAGDLICIGFGGLMLSNFITFYLHPVLFEIAYAKANMIISGIVMIIGFDRAMQDAMKGA